MTIFLCDSGIYRHKRILLKHDPLENTMKFKTLFFDVNETLIDIIPLRKAAADRLGGGKAQADRWFSGLLHYSLVETLCGGGKDFAEIGAAVLAMQVAEDGGTIKQDEALELIKQGLSQSKAHPEVASALERLHAHGFTLVALTNSGGKSLAERLESQNIAQYFSAMLSVQETGAYKPDQRTYRYALDKTGAEKETSIMIAAHPWDLMGARSIGLATAFIARARTSPYPLAEEPDISATDIAELADILLGQL